MYEMETFNSSGGGQINSKAIEVLAWKSISNRGETRLELKRMGGVEGGSRSSI